MKISSPLVYVAPVFLLALCVELLIDRRRHLKLYQSGDFWANFGIGLGDIFFGVAATYLHMGIIFFLYDDLAGLRQEYLGYGTLGYGPLIWILGFLCDDFSYYWFHRLGHTVRVLWAGHVVHHSSGYCNFSTALRNGWLSILYKPVFWYWMAALGFSPLMMNVYFSINATYQFFCHTQLLKVPEWVEKIFVTPRSHVVHHGVNQEYVDKNYGGVLIIFDRIFGTYARFDPSVHIAFGVTKPPHSNNLIEITIHELRNMKEDLSKARNWRERLHYIFDSPAWKP